MNYKLLIAVAGSIALAGCASGPDEATTEQITAMSSQIEALESKIDSLESGMKSDAMAASEAKQMAMSAEDEAARANERLDNLAQSYTK
jgi:murein lipoprotein